MAPKNGNGHPVRILVADDHETVRKGIVMILSSRMKLGEYGEAANGLEAIEKAQELEPDLIVGSSRVDLQACKLEYSIVSPK